MSIDRPSLFQTINELLFYEDEQFIQCAYYTILGRKADLGGLAVYLERLRKGADKLEVIAILARSPEGKACGVKTISLEISIVLLRILNFPLMRVLLKKPRIPEFFDPVFYLQENADVAKAHLGPYFHYANHGAKEGRCPAFDADWYQSEYPDVVGSGYSPEAHYNRYGRAQKRSPWFAAQWYLKENPDVAVSGLDAYAHYDQIGRRQGRQPAYVPRNDYRKWLALFDTPTKKMRDSIRARAATFLHNPVISIVMPVTGTARAQFQETLDSIRNQIYRRWELCIGYDSKIDSMWLSHLKLTASEDHRIKLCEAGGGIIRVRNAAIGLVTGDWIASLELGDVLAESSFFWVVDAINDMPDIVMIYSDEDLIDGEGIRFSPHFNCDWNSDLFYSRGVVPSFTVYRSTLVSGVNAYRSEFEGCEKFDLALRCLEAVGPNQVHHISRVLYHRRVLDRHTANSIASQSSANPLCLSALNEHLGRLALNADAEKAPYGYRLRYSLPTDLPLVSLIIPTRNGFHLLCKCVESIIRNSAYSRFEILIIDNGSDDAETLQYLKSVARENNIRVIRDDRPFNFSVLNNMAVKQAMGTIIGLINNDIEVIAADWLTEMVSHALRPGIAAVGARLLYPDDTLQHAGIILGAGQAWHAHRNIAKHDPGYMGRAMHIQSFSAVTGACLIVRRSVYDELGGLNEADLSVTFNDVDFCLRALKAGYKNIWTPYAELYHHESASRGQSDTPEKATHARKELEYMQARWTCELFFDPAYSPNLSNESEDFSLAWPPRADKICTIASRPKKKSVRKRLKDLWPSAVE